MQRKCNKVDRVGKGYLYFFISFACIILVASLYTTTVAADTYIPAAPQGPEKGVIGTDYEYTIYTTSHDSRWMFDWGDGKKTDWLSCQIGENSITQSHQWNAAGIYKVRVKFQNSYFSQGVWSDPHMITIYHFGQGDSPQAPEVVFDREKGCANAEYSLSIYGSDPTDDDLQYRVDFGDNTITEWTPLVSSETSLPFNHVWISPGKYQIKAQSKDEYGLLSEWSEYVLIFIESDTDLDKVSDDTEIVLGSDMNDPDDVTLVTYNGKSYAVIKIFDGSTLFYNPYLDTASTIDVHHGKTSYLIDADDDGTYDFLYNPSENALEQYLAPPADSSVPIPWTMIGLFSFIIGSIITVLFLKKIGFIYIYEEEFGVDE